MISFRYHIVSLVAAFLALALGIVIGTTALNGPVTADLRRQVDDLKSDRGTLAAQVKTLHGQLDTAADFARSYGTNLVAGTLDHHKVVVLSLPGVTTGMADGVGQQLTAAGATITGRVRLAPGFVDPASETAMGTLATGPAHPLGLTLPETSDGRALGAALLSFVLVGKGQDTDLKSVLSGFDTLHLLDSDPSAVEPATNVVVLGSGSSPSSPYAGQAEYDIVAQLVAAGGHVVVAGDSPAATGNGVVAEVRRGAVEGDVSTVDNADTAFGEVSTVLALAATIKGNTGQYGTGTGAQALFPSAGR